MNQKKRLTILYISFWPWKGLWSGPQHIASQLSEEYEIIYVNPIPFGFSYQKSQHLSKLWKLKKEKISRSITALSFFFFPSSFINHINQWNHEKWANAVVNYIKDEGIVVDILWLTSPDQLVFLEKVQSSLTCYHCLDSYESFYPRMAKTEPEIFKRSDVVFVTAPLLQDKAEKYNSEVYLIPNGVEVDHFQAAIYSNFLLPEDMINIPSPRIGYIGSIDHWLDFEIIQDLSSDNDISIVLIGPINSKKAINLGKKDNIYLLGKKPYNTLPSYLGHIDLCIIPFKENKLTRAVDPNKVYEYLAAGKQVISTPLPAIERLSNLIVLSKPKNFLVNAQKMLANPLSRELSLEKSQAMLDHTWEKRAESIKEVFKQKGV